MIAMQLRVAASRCLEQCDREVPEPGPGEVRIRVQACGVCRTDLHIVDGELPPRRLPIVPGHEVVGTIEAVGAGVTLTPGTRVGVPWLGWTCGTCPACRAGRENLCERARFTGYDADGGFAALTIADARYCFLLPPAYSDVQAAPLLCAGLIGFRAYRMTGEPRRLGLYGFGAAAHILTQLAVQDGREVFAFTRRGDTAAQGLARELGAAWAGASDEPPPAVLDAAIIFAPVGALVPEALRHVVPAGIVVCAGIHMSDIPAFPYRRLWEERVVRSVANLTRADGREFFARVGVQTVRTHVRLYPLANANAALDDLRQGRIQGAAVLTL